MSDEQTRLLQQIAADLQYLRNDHDRLVSQLEQYQQETRQTAKQQGAEFAVMLTNIDGLKKS